MAAAIAMCITGTAVLTSINLVTGNIIETGSTLSIKNNTVAISCTSSHDTTTESITFENVINKNVTDIAAMIEEARPPLVFIDAGHGGEDGGCVSGKVLEKNVNLEIAKLVKARLENSGYKVIMSREDDTFISKEDRVEAANSAKADIYVSIHQNFSEDSKVKGMEVWYDGTDTKRDNKKLAQLIKQQTIKTTESVEREIRENADFYVTGNTTMPACLIETGFLSNAAERGNLTGEEYQNKIADGIANGIEYYFNPKTMYLTFDDGPSEENTEKVLDILKERGIKATFFLIGENVRKYPDVARRIVAEGHTIGIHSDSHNYDVIYKSADAFINDFENAHKTVYEVTGVDTKLFRFPGGSINDYNKNVSADIIEKMTERGYIYYDWNASLEDADTKKDLKVEELIENGVTTTLGRNKIVMLAHDVVDNTSLCLNELLDNLPEYEIKPIDEDVTPIQF
ncbi:MAG: N-acetylmuramoyl-L-alanine amidase [Lachnospiraceae bacterium]|nr:N-acetylmuramoyl-L-alanine amidase [Lachnospiraceae bacterium]